MFAYWFLFAYFAAGVFLTSPRDRLAQPGLRVFLGAGAMLIAVLVGFRHEVGADWYPYQRMFAVAGFVDFDRVLQLKDPGYQLLNSIAQQVGAGIWLVNLVCGLILAWGLSRFAKTQPDPWLVFLLAIPYLVVVVAMGYSRQAVAIGVLLAGLATMSRGGGSALRFAGYVAAAALFHKTAVIALLLVAFATNRNKWLDALIVGAGFILMYDIFLDDSVDELVATYIDAEYSSQGAAIRIAMTVVPATMFLLSPGRFGFSGQEQKIWRNFSIATFTLLALLFVLPSSTAVDRLSLYVIPLQLAVLSRIPAVYPGKGLGRFIIVIYCFAVQYAWLNYASHAPAWIPYRSSLF